MAGSKDAILRFLEPNHIPVPTHFFMVIVPNANENTIEAYIVPNQKIDDDVSSTSLKFDACLSQENKR